MSGLDNEMWDREYRTEEEIQEEINGTSNMYEDQDEEFFDEYDEDYDEYDEEEINNFTEEQSLMDSARIRLEQGRLYEMLIKHNLFGDVDSIPEAVEKVEGELKNFIMERLEILLGMRAEREVKVQEIVQRPQFNDMEVQALKMMASKVTKGASATAPTSQPETTSSLNTVKKERPESKINALSSRPVAQKPVVTKQTPPPMPQREKPRKKRRRPQQASKPQQPQRKLKKEMAEVATKGMTPEAAAKRDLDYVNNLKGMSIEEANKIVSERHKRPIPKSSMTQESVNAHYQGQMSMNETAQTFTALLAAAKKVN